MQDCDSNIYRHALYLRATKLLPVTAFCCQPARCSARRAESLCKCQTYLLYRLYSLNTRLHALFTTWSLFLTLKCGGVGESETCWVFEHSSGIGVCRNNALQEHCHVRDFVCCQLFQRSLQRPAENRVILNKSHNNLHALLLHFRLSSIFLNTLGSCWKS